MVWVEILDFCYCCWRKKKRMSAFLMGTDDVDTLSYELEDDQSLVSYEDGDYQDFSGEDYDPNFDALFGEEEYREMGINPDEATQAKPGSEQKVLMLAARYAAGLPLWNNSDCYDHGPGENLLQGLLA
ncbi:hypothetical protein [Gimesia sp.]|uniref:hypothetical protein n=1 Tax=Gimesia sp. TaxID=2024833 RepID=UPI003A94D5BA